MKLRSHLFLFNDYQIEYEDKGYKDTIILNNASILNIFFEKKFQNLTDYPLQKYRIVCGLEEKIACVLFL